MYIPNTLLRHTSEAKMRNCCLDLPPSPAMTTSQAYSEDTISSDGSYHGNGSEWKSLRSMQTKLCKPSEACDFIHDK